MNGREWAQRKKNKWHTPYETNNNNNNTFVLYECVGRGEYYGGGRRDRFGSECKNIVPRVVCVQ